MLWIVEAQLTLLIMDYDTHASYRKNRSPRKDLEMKRYTDYVLQDIL